MSGNEILLNLENYEHLRPSELCAALIELSKREGHEGKKLLKQLNLGFLCNNWDIHILDLTGKYLANITWICFGIVII